MIRADRVNKREDCLGGQSFCFLFFGKCFQDMEEQL